MYDSSSLQLRLSDNSIIFLIGDCEGPWRRKYTLLAEHIDSLGLPSEVWCLHSDLHDKEAPKLD